MPVLNADCPVFDCWVRTEYLFDMDPARVGDFERCTVFQVTAIKGRAIGFWCLIHATGAVFGRLPVSAFSSTGMDEAGYETMPLHYLELWDAFSYDLTVSEMGHLAGRRCEVKLKNGNTEGGRYMFTVDFYGSDYAENAGESGWKCAHMIELDCGVYALQPNNRILWADPATVTRPFAWDDVPPYRLVTTEWQCEQVGRWVTSEDTRYFYGVSEKAQESEAVSLS